MGQNEKLEKEFYEKWDSDFYEGSTMQGGDIYNPEKIWDWIQEHFISKEEVGGIIEESVVQGMICFEKQLERITNKWDIIGAIDFKFETIDQLKSKYLRKEK